jgi:hypothetical protein
MGHSRLPACIEVADGQAIAMKAGQTPKVPTCHAVAFPLAQLGHVARWLVTGV